MLELAIPGLFPQKDFYEILEKPCFEVTINGEKIFLRHNDILGSGCTKVVYDVAIRSQRFALGLPNGSDLPLQIERNWKEVLKEPVTTKSVRKLGLLANPLCEIIPVKIGDTSFPGILMLRYKDLDYGIMDPQDNRSTTVKKGLLSHRTNVESFTKLLSTGVKDLSILVKNRLFLYPDSFNIAVLDSKLRLYLNDLGSASFKNQNEWNNEYYARLYARNFIFAFVQGLSTEEYLEHEKFFEENVLEFEAQDRIINSLLQTI